MKNVLFYTFFAAMLTLSAAASATEHKVDCAHKENAEKPECKDHKAGH